VLEDNRVYNSFCDMNNILSVFTVQFNHHVSMT
jgi:hypothetical protein